jgi:hypothetical protein
MTDQPLDDIDTLLQTALPDDLPPDVEARLNDRVDRFLIDRRLMASGRLTVLSGRLTPARVWVALWQTGHSLRVAASAALVVVGIVLHTAGGPGLFAAPVARVQESAALWKALRNAGSMRCTGAARDDLGSPTQFADRVYRRWVLVASRIDATATDKVLTFTSPDDGSRYELSVDGRSMLPHRVVKTMLAGVTATGRVAAGYDASCRWGPQVPEERTDGQR